MINTEVTAINLNIVDGVTEVVGSRLGFTGVFGDIILSGGALLAPGTGVRAGVAAGPDTETIETGSLLFSESGELRFEIIGTSQAEYDRIEVNGTVDLGEFGAGFALFFDNGFAPVVGDSFNIIDNDGTDAIRGYFTPQFLGFEALRDRDVFQFEGHDLRITYRGGDGNDLEITAVQLINGTKGKDVISVTQTAPSQALPGDTPDVIMGFGGNDKLSGEGGDDDLDGGKGKDKLSGGSGKDYLIGGKHKDKLTGGDDADSFVFDVKLKTKWADRISDFEVGIDTIVLDRSRFSSLEKTGVLNKKNFSDGKPKDKNDYIIQKGKKLFYDADGSKKGSDAVLFAKVQKGVDLSADDFFVV